MFEELPALDAACRHLTRRRTAIQAGGNCGVFPAKLAKGFARVITAEPDPTCFSCLDVNVPAPNVVKLNVAFADVAKSVSLVFNKDTDNFGARHIVDDGDLPALTIDSLKVEDCDLLYLDIEGSEMLALKGAAATIALSRPVISIEENGLHDLYGVKKGEAAEWLKQFGYKQVGHFKRDIVFAVRQ